MGNRESKLKSALLLGYIVSINNSTYSMGLEYSIYEAVPFISSKNSIFHLCDELHYKVFDDHIPSEMENIRDLRKYSAMLFEFISARVQRGDERDTGFSFYLGGLLGMSIENFGSLVNQKILLESIGRFISQSGMDRGIFDSINFINVFLSEDKTQKFRFVTTFVTKVFEANNISQNIDDYHDEFSILTRKLNFA